jgi:DNA-binding beta-propeller fold protein YncE
MRSLVVTVVLLGACVPVSEAGCPESRGTLCPFAGTGYPGVGSEDEPRLDSPLYLPQDVAVGPDGRVWVVDWNNHRVRLVEADGRMVTALGSGRVGDAVDGPAREVSLERPTHVAFDGQGRPVLSAWSNAKVLRLESSGRLETIAGTGKRGFLGDGGPATQATLDLPVSTALGPDGSLYIADQGNLRVRRLDPAGTLHTVAGSGEEGFEGDGGPATAAKLKGPVGQSAWPSGKVAVDAAGNLYLADSGNQRVRRVSAVDGVITTVAGSGAEEGPMGEGVPAVQARLARPTDVAVGPDGALYIADTDHSCIRKVDAAGLIHTVAGVCGEAGSTGDEGPATRALLSRPFGIDVGPDGTLYIADTFNHRIRLVRP